MSWIRWAPKPNRSAFAGLPALAVIALTACGGAEEDDEELVSTGRGWTVGAVCTSGARALDDLNEVDPGMGFSARDVVDLVAANANGSLEWTVPRGAVTGLEGQQGTIRLAADPSQVTNPRVLQSGHEGCASVLEVEVALQLQTMPGAVDVTFPGKLRATSKYFAELSGTLLPAQFNGALAEVRNVDGLDVKSISVQAFVSSLGSVGNLMVQMFAIRGELAFGSVDELARWPAGDACAQAEESFGALTIAMHSGATLAGMAAEDIPSLFENLSSRSVAWQDGSSAMLSMSAVPSGPVCAHLNLGEQPTLQYPAAVQLESDDGRLSATYSGEVTAEASPNGGLEVATLQAYLRELEPNTIAATAGIHGVDASAFAWVNLDVQLKRNLVSGADTGHVRAYGQSQEGCAAVYVNGQLDETPCPAGDGFILHASW